MFNKEGFTDATDDFLANVANSKRRVELTWEGIWNARLIEQYQTKHVIYLISLLYIAFEVFHFMVYYCKYYFLKVKAKACLKKRN